MSQCVPSWDLEDINNNVFKLDNEVSELTWKNGQVATQELDPRRVANRSQPTDSSWDKPRALETLEAIVNQATHQPYTKTHVNDNNLVPWLNVKPHDKPTKPMASDGLVPSTLDAGCSTHVGSCSADVSGFMGRRVVLENDWNISVSESESGSGRDDSKSSLPDDDSACHRTFQWEANRGKEKKRGKVKSSTTTTSNKRRRTAAIHNQSERKRRDKINQRINTLQKLVPNSNKTDKASMLDEVIEYVKQLQAQVHVVNGMYLSPMMLPLVMQQQQQQQQQQQMQLFMMNSMGMGMGMGMDMNTIGLSNMSAPYFPSAFMHMPSWNNRATDRVINTTMATDPMSAFLACQSQPVMNMDSYSRMAALYQHMQNQPPAGPFHR